MKKSFDHILVNLTVTVIFLLPSNSLMLSSDLLMKADDSYKLEAKNRTNTPFTTVQDLHFMENETKITGAYIPDTLHLEDMEVSDQRLAILEFLEQGFNEYYFVMDNFRDPEEVESTERLLDNADNTELKLVIIL
jgi:hypothetical protein